MFKYVILRKNFDVKNTKKLLRWIFENFGSTRTTELIERLKNFGFHVATKYNASIGIESVHPLATPGATMLAHLVAASEARTDSGAGRQEDDAVGDRRKKHVQLLPVR